MCTDWNGLRTAANFRIMISFKSAEHSPFDLDINNDMTSFLREYGAKLPANSLATGNITLTPPEPTDENLTSNQASDLANMLAQNQKALAQNQKATQELMATNRELKKSLRTVTDAILGINIQETAAARKIRNKKKRDTSFVSLNF